MKELIDLINSGQGVLFVSVVAFIVLWRTIAPYARQDPCKQVAESLEHLRTDMRQNLNELRDATNRTNELLEQGQQRHTELLAAALKVDLTVHQSRRAIEPPKHLRSQ